MQDSVGFALLDPVLWPERAGKQRILRRTARPPRIVPSVVSNVMRLFDPVFAAVEGYPIKPGKELGVTLEAVDGFVRAHEHDLRDILSIIVVVHVGISEPKDSVSISAMDHRKRFLRSVSDPVAQYGIRAGLSKFRPLSSQNLLLAFV